MKIICYGDSNTWGFDPRSFLGSRYDSPWPELLAEKTSWNVINQGENGREIPRTPVAFPDDADLLIIMLGTNDLLQGKDPDTVCKRMEQFLRSLTFPKERILVVAPPALCLGAWVSQQELADRSLSLALMYRMLTQRIGTGFFQPEQGSIPLTFDGVHFTQEGHRAFSEQLYTAVTARFTHE